MRRRPVGSTNGGDLRLPSRGVTGLASALAWIAPVSRSWRWRASGALGDRSEGQGASGSRPSRVAPRAVTAGKQEAVRMTLARVWLARSDPAPPPSAQPVFACRSSAPYLVKKGLLRCYGGGGYTPSRSSVATAETGQILRFKPFRSSNVAACRSGATMRSSNGVCYGPTLRQRTASFECFLAFVGEHPGATAARAADQLIGGEGGDGALDAPLLRLAVTDPAGGLCHLRH